MIGPSRPRDGVREPANSLGDGLCTETDRSCVRPAPVRAFAMEWRETCPTSVSKER